MKKGDYASYKNRTYRVVYQGVKDGKAITKLAFLDGSSEFWASNGPVTPTTKPPATRRFGFARGRPCGYPGCDGIQFCDECSE